MLLQDQELRLVSGGDCPDHNHSYDRTPTHDFLVGLQGIASVAPTTGNVTLGDNDDHVLVDTTAGTVTVTLPRATSGREYEVTKVTAPNSVNVVPSGTDTVLGTTGVTWASQWTSIRFKAITGGWVAI